LLNDKIRSFVHGQMRNLLGEVDEDLADFIFEHLREHKGPDNLFDDLEPVGSSVSDAGPACADQALFLYF
jgi:hypothetical protein